MKAGLAAALSTRRRPAAKADRGAPSAVPRSNDNTASDAGELPRGSLHWDAPVPVTTHSTGVKPVPYRSRKGEVKVATHWGQRKLLMSELQLLLPPFTPPDQRCHVVYVGSAPGTHLALLDDLFDRRHTWHLVDPGRFVPSVRDRSNFLVDNSFFDNAAAYAIALQRLAAVAPALASVFSHAIESTEAETDVARPWRSLETGDLDAARTSTDIPTLYEPELPLPVGLNLLRIAASERKPLLFVSDVRTGTAAMPNFASHVVENMMAQATWTRILHPTRAMLKFRLPYSTDAAQLPEYLDGDVLLPIWGPMTTTECRLVVSRPFSRRQFDPVDHERRMFFFNATLRERVHFNHDLSPHQDLDNRFDSAAEIAVWNTYRAAIDSTRSVKQLVSLVTAALGESFEDIRRKRDALIVSATVIDGGTVKRYRPEHATAADDDVKTADADGVATERMRSVWWTNVDTTKLLPAAGLECCALLPS